MTTRRTARLLRLVASLCAALLLTACPDVDQPEEHAAPVGPEVADTDEPLPEAAFALPEPPPADARHAVLVWTYSDDARRPELASALRELGAHGLSLGAESDPVTFVAAGLAWYADDAAGKGSLALREREWRAPWDRFAEDVATAWPSESVRSRPHCLRRPEVRADMLLRTQEAAKRASASGATAISLADEPSMTVRANPGDWCLCGLCVDAFRASMRAQFDGDLRALNAAWATSYANWDEVLPWTTTQMRRRCFEVPPDKWNLAPWIATRAFQDETFAETLRLLVDASHAAAPGVPVGVTGTQAPGAFGGFDYRRLTAVCDFLEPYDIGLALPVARDLGHGRVLLGQTLFPADGDPPLERLRLWRGVARGATVSIVWSSRDALEFSDDVPGAGLSAYGARLAPELRLLTAEGGVGARLAAARSVDDGVRIVVSQPSFAVRWMLDSREDADTWPRRFGSYEAEHSGAIAAREAAWRALAGRAPRFVDARDLAAPGAFDGVELVVLPDMLCLAADEARALRAFADAGGRIVADVHPGGFDTDGRARANAAQWSGLRVALDPGFARLAALADETLGPPLLRAAAVGGPPGASLEFGLFERGDERLAVVVPFAGVVVAPDGSASGALPAAGLRVLFSFGDGRRRAVRDARTGRLIGGVARWEFDVPPEGGLVFGWREPGADASRDTR